MFTFRLAAVAFGLVRNHGFSDGNKRTAWVAARLFLLNNGFKLFVEPEDAIHAMAALADTAMSEDDFAAWLRQEFI